MTRGVRLHPWRQPGFLEERNGILFFDGFDCTALASEHGTPLIVYSARRLRETARRMRAAFAAEFGRFRICYAAKAGSLPGVLQLLREERISVEVNSGGELQRARAAGFAPDEIVFNGVAKSLREISEALDPAIKSINVDSLCELERIAAVARERAVIANVALRVTPELESGTTPGTETASSLTKFGMTRADFRTALARLPAMRDAVRLRGVHVHVGSQVNDTGVYTRASGFLAEIASEAQAATGEALDHVNAGGGFAVNYLKYDEANAPAYLRAPASLPDYAAAIAQPLRTQLGTDTELVVEPGRALVADSALLISRIENTKQRKDGRWICLDAGYHTLLDAFSYKWYYHMVNASRAAGTETDWFRVVGPLCDNGDSFHDVDGETTLRRLLRDHPSLGPQRGALAHALVRLPTHRELPAATAPGDLIALLDVGAYSTEQVFGMNGRGRPAIVLLDEDGTVRRLRSADTREDLFLNESR